MSLGRIGWLAIRQYAQAFDFDEVQTEDLFYFVRSMDSAYLQREKEKADNK